MAGDTELSESDGKVYKCHSNLRVPKIVICIVCENVYHPSDFVRLCKDKGKFVSEMFVVCPAHHDENLTFNKDIDNIQLNEETRLLISKIKLYEKEKGKEDMNKSIALNLTKDNLLLDNTVIEYDLAAMRVENELLKTLNQELQDKNALLHELISLKQNNEYSHDSHSYANAVKQDINKREIIPDIVIRAKNNDNSKTMEKVKNKIIADITVPIKKIVSNKNGEVTIKCQNRIDVTRTSNLLSEKMKSDYQVDTQSVELPKLKIHDIQNDLNLQELEEDIKDRNSFMLSGTYKIINEYKNPRKQRIAIMSVSPEIYEKIVKNNYKLFIGFQCCKLYDVLNINLCYKCGRLNHSSKHCRNEPKCLRCSGDHLTSDCGINELKCLNCDYYNKKYKQNKCTNHHPNDTSTCEYLRHRINKILNETDYPTLPKIPKFIGKLPGQVI